MAERTGNVCLESRNMTKKIGDFTALETISLDVYVSVFVRLQGPSGRGKMTLRRAAVGMDSQTFGTICQAGKDFSDRAVQPPGDPILPYPWNWG